MAAISMQSQKNAERMQMKLQAAQEAANERARIEAEGLRLQKLSERQVEMDWQASISAERALRNKKEQAWLEFYKPVKGCESSNYNKDIIKCGNDYAKAKKNFESKWRVQHQ